jgi:hypothetical protein
VKQLSTPKVIQQLQKEGITTPRLFIKVLVSLDEFAKKTGDSKDKDSKGKAKMTAVKAKSFNAMKQKVKKLLKQYEKEIEEYKKVNKRSCKFNIRLLLVLKMRKKMIGTPMKTLKKRKSNRRKKRKMLLPKTKRKNMRADQPLIVNQTPMIRVLQQKEANGNYLATLFTFKVRSSFF